MIEKHFKKLVLLLVILALGYWGFISRYQHIEGGFYLDRWANTITQMPFAIESESANQIKNKEAGNPIWENSAAETQKEWYGLYLNLLDQYHNSKPKILWAECRARIDSAWNSFKSEHPEIPPSAAAPGF